jgi:hypothetical protein
MELIFPAFLNCFQTYIFRQWDLFFTVFFLSMIGVLVGGPTAVCGWDGKRKTACAEGFVRQ